MHIKISYFLKFYSFIICLLVQLSLTSNKSEFRGFFTPERRKGSEEAKDAESS